MHAFITRVHTDSRRNRPGSFVHPHPASRVPFPCPPLPHHFASHLSHLLLSPHWSVPFHPHRIRPAIDFRPLVVVAAAAFVLLSLLSCIPNRRPLVSRHRPVGWLWLSPAWVGLLWTVCCAASCHAAPLPANASSLFTLGGTILREPEQRKRSKRREPVMA